MVRAEKREYKKRIDGADKQVEKQGVLCYLNGLRIFFSPRMSKSFTRAGFYTLLC